MTIAIIKYTRTADNKVAPGDVWAFAGLTVIMVAVMIAVVFGLSFTLAREQYSGIPIGFKFMATRITNLTTSRPIV